MAGRYLPTELQNDDGDVIYPHSSAEVIWMQDGRSVEATIGEKSSVIMTTGEIPVEQRQENNIYLFKKEDGTTQIEDYQGHKIYPRPDMLSTMEEVEANTTANKSVDALVVKELNSCLKVEVDVQNGTPVWKERGADAWNPFKTNPIFLGTGNQFNVSNIDGINITTLTENNFFAEIADGNKTTTGGGNEDYNRLTSKLHASYNKNYNNATGVLSINFSVNSRLYRHDNSVSGTRCDSSYAFNVWLVL